jgi:cation:H+ antiporter
MKMRLVLHELPILIAVTASAVLLGWDGAVGRGDGILLLAGFLVFVIYVGRTVRRGPPDMDMRTEQIETVREVRFRHDGRVWSGATLVAGLALLIAGAEVLVEAASALALALGVSEVVIGLTTVAFGTSLPEMVTCAVAVIRGEPDLALGNVVGSNIFNCLAVLGLGSVIRPLAVGSPLFAFEIPVMLVLTVLLLPFARAGRDIDRPIGAGLVGAYLMFLLVVGIRAL